MASLTTAEILRFIDQLTGPTIEGQLQRDGLRIKYRDDAGVKILAWLSDTNRMILETNGTIVIDETGEIILKS